MTAVFVSGSVSIGRLESCINLLLTRLSLEVKGPDICVLEGKSDVQQQELALSVAGVLKLVFGPSGSVHTQ